MYNYKENQFYIPSQENYFATCQRSRIMHTRAKDCKIIMDYVSKLFWKLMEEKSDKPLDETALKENLGKLSRVVDLLVPSHPWKLGDPALQKDLPEL